MIDPNKMLANFEAQDSYVANLQAENRQLRDTLETVLNTLHSALHGKSEATKNCANDWHRNKHVSVDRCPGCSMTLADFNQALKDGNTP